MQGLPSKAAFAGLGGAAAGLVLSRLRLAEPRPYLLVCADNREAERLAADLRFFASGGNYPILEIPVSEADPYRGLSPHPEITEKRAAALWELLQVPEAFVVTTIRSLATRLPKPEKILAETIELEAGREIAPRRLLGRLKRIGYRGEDLVNEWGEFSKRGGIIDIFSVAKPHPVRLEFFGDQIESIREFAPGSQRSVRLIPHCQIVPACEMLIGEAELKRWHRQAPLHWNEIRFSEALEEKLQFTADGELFNGFEYLFPLTLKNPSNLLEYAGWSAARPPRVIWHKRQEIWEEFKRIQDKLEKDFKQRDLEGEPSLAPARLFLKTDSLKQLLGRFPSLELQKLTGERTQVFDFRRERPYQNRMQDLLNDLQRWKKRGERTVMAMGSKGMSQRLVDVLREYEWNVDRLEGGLDQALASPTTAVIEGPVSSGFYSRELRLHLLTQHEVFGKDTSSPKVTAVGLQKVSGSFLSDFRDLKPNDHVVHIDHGIARFKGLKKIEVGRTLREFVELVYQGNSKLYVPVEHLHLLQKFSGSEVTPQLDRLGGASWARTKKRIKKSVRRLAGDLLKLYAQREVSKGHAFSPDDALMREFEDAFEYQETPDQKAAIESVKRDMESERPMDRLVCGDVGYGKTEVAMRAAFKAVEDGRQAAVLAPTTVLAFQHLNTFDRRFRGFPVNIEMLSRFRSRAEQKRILEKTRLGLVDILIGTHRLLSKDVGFQRLGLIIVDEEQRFGVAQKEKLKRLKTQVDVLTLSATPIPRTLNMSMIGIRDLCLIQTPPKYRLAVQTAVVKFSRRIVASAIDLELKRSGQVFFLHNSVETIDSIAKLVKETVPEARVAVSHGQMPEKRLEEVMLAFLNYEIDVLVCTTIIENGLDIPRANTLIVNRADRFGLAQLYQLRGRVGRARRRAYAYLLIPSQETMSTVARKRLRAIREFSDLGSGFRVAALDLEIRGAGNLLGAEQHGHIASVGLELYLKLLREAMHELKGDVPQSAPETRVELRLDIRIPEHYIDDPNQRLWLYKRVASLKDEKSWESLKNETLDRYGKCPRSVANLFEYSRLRILAGNLGILSLQKKGTTVSAKFHPDTPLDVDQLMGLLVREERFSISPGGVLEIETAQLEGRDLLKSLRHTLSQLAMLK